MSQKKIKGLAKRLLRNVRLRERLGMDKKKWLKKCEDRARAKRKKLKKQEQSESGYQERIIKRRKKK